MHNEGRSQKIFALCIQFMTNRVVICTNVTIVILVDQMIQGLDIYGRGITLKLVIQLVLSEPQGNPNIVLQASLR